MPHAAIVSVAKFVRTFFYTFLDISGILLGVFLIAVGAWVITVDRSRGPGCGCVDKSKDTANMQ